MEQWFLLGDAGRLRFGGFGGSGIADMVQSDNRHVHGEETGRWAAQWA
jgi:hypothetical protein